MSLQERGSTSCRARTDTVLGSREATVSTTTQSTPSPSTLQARFIGDSRHGTRVKRTSEGNLIEVAVSAGAARAAFVLMTSQLDSNSPSKKGVQSGAAIAIKASLHRYSKHSSSRISRSANLMLVEPGVPDRATKLAGSQGGSQVGGSQAGGSHGPPAQPLSFLQPPDQTEPGGTVPTPAAQLGTGLPHTIAIASRLQQQAEPSDQGMGEIRIGEPCKPANELRLPHANREPRPEPGQERLQAEEANDGEGSQHHDGRCAGSQPAGTLAGSQPGEGGGQLGWIGMQVAGQQVRVQQQATPIAGGTETQSVPLQPAEKLTLHGFSRFGRMQDRQADLATRQAMEAPPPAHANPCSSPAVTWEAVEHVSDTTAEEGLSDPVDRQISNMTAEGGLSVPSTSAPPDSQQSQPGEITGTQAALQTSQQHPGQQAHHGARLKRARTSPSGTPEVLEDREKRARLDAGDDAIRALMVPAAGEACIVPAMLTTQTEGGCVLGKQAGRGHPSSVENSSEEQELSLTPQLQPSLQPPQPAGSVPGTPHHHRARCLVFLIHAICHAYTQCQQVLGWP